MYIYMTLVTTTRGIMSCIMARWWDMVTLVTVIQWKSLRHVPTTRYLMYMVAKTHRMPYLFTIFSAKEPYNKWLF